MSVTASARLRLAQATAAEWAASNPTLLAGEIGLVAGTPNFKVGPGVWAALPLYSMAGAPGANGTNGTNGTNGAPGSDGTDGREIELGLSATHVRWRYVGETWVDLVPLSSLVGPAGANGTNGTNGTNGVDGREIELGLSATHVRWRYVGDAWVDLVSLASLTGPAGANGTNGTNGSNGTNGVDGLSVELQKTATHIQWRPVGGTWANLAALADITGPAGAAGAGGSYGFPPCTVLTPEISTNAVISLTAGWVMFHRARIDSAVTISKMALQMGASSGNICVGVARGTAGRSNPTNIIATSGPVAAPAVNTYAEIPLLAAVTIQPGDWFFIACDNITAQCSHGTGEAGAARALALGFCNRSNGGVALSSLVVGAVPALANPPYNRRAAVLIGVV